MSTDLKPISRRITNTLFLTQSFSSAAIITVGTILSILAKDLSGNAAMAGYPNAVNLLSAAVSAYIWGNLWDRIGRRKGITLGLFIGMLGFVIAFFAVQSGSFIFLLVGFIGIGFTRSATQLGRFVAAEVNPPKQRGRAISIVIWGGTVGAVVGPLLAVPGSDLALRLGFVKLSGPFLVAIGLMIINIFVTYRGLNPEPTEISKKITAQYPDVKESSGTSRTIRELLKHRLVFVAMVTMVIGQVVMAWVMGMTALYMDDNQMTIESISIVLSAHTLGMFAFSIVTGQLVDRWGRMPVIISGIAMLLASFILAPIYMELLPIGIAMFLLGLGWNFCFVGGSTLLADQLSPAERSRTQGFNDFLISIVTASASVMSGIIYASQGYQVLNMVGGGLSLIPLVLILWLIFSNKRQAQFSPGID